MVNFSTRYGYRNVEVQIGSDRIGYETINITMLRRGVIGINKIGYVF